MAETTSTDKVTVYTFNVYVTVPMDRDDDGLFATYTGKEMGQCIQAALRRIDGDVDYELMDTEIKDEE